MLRGHTANLQRTLAKAQSRKIWLRVSRGPLQKGQTQAFASSKIINLPILALEGRMSQPIFQSKCFNLA
jgi:outer membrane PBP1 activator LpoA protein